MVRSRSAIIREERATKDAADIEGWCGPEVWRSMVRKSMLGLKYIHQHKDDPEFWSKTVLALANQFLACIIFLNSYPGRCGGWELITTEEMLSQLSSGEPKNILVFRKHEPRKWYGHLKKWVPKPVFKALVMYSGLTLGQRELFLGASWYH